MRLFGFTFPRPAPEPQPEAAPGEPQPRAYVRVTGSVGRRMIFIAAGWILLLLVGGAMRSTRCW